MINLKITDMKKSIELPPSFAEAHIPLRQELMNHIFLLSNGDLGLVYEINGIYDEPLTSQELEEKIYPLFKFVRQLCVGIPAHSDYKNTAIQIICSGRQIEKPLPKPLTKPIETQAYSFSQTDVGHILETEEELLFQLGLVKRRFFLTVRFKPVYKKSKILGTFFNALKLGKSKRVDGEKTSLILKAAKEFDDILKNQEMEFSLGGKLERLGAEDVIKYLENVIHGAKSPPHIFTGDKTISQNIYNPKTASDAQGFMLDDKTRLSSFILDQLPREGRVGLLKHFMDALPVKNWDLVWCFTGGQRVFGSALSAQASWFSHGPAHQTKYDELIHFQNNVDTLRPHGVQSFRLLTYGCSEAESSQIQTLAVDYIGARLVPEKQIGVHMVTSSLPLCLDPTCHNLPGRSKTIRLENATFFWPIFDGPSQKEGTRWFVSRCNTPTRFDLFAGEGNRMTTILGTSRAGKSCLMNQLLLEFMDRFPDGLIRIIDKKTSYLKLADLLGGKIVSFSESFLRKNPYSPFALENWNDDDIETLYVLVATAMTQKNPGIHLSSIHAEILRDAIKLAFNNHAINVEHAKDKVDHIDPHPIWTDILAALPTAAGIKEENNISGANQAKEDLTKWSVNLTKTGQYGFIFSSHEKKTSFTHQARFLTYDLDGIADPVLQLLASQMAFLKITRDFATLSRGTPKLIVFEEMGMLLHGDSEAQKLNEAFIQNVVKTCAKLNAVGISITNSVADYADQAAGRIFWNMATQRLFLPLNKAMIAELSEKFKGEFSSADLQILGSLNIDRNLKRSQLYIKSENTTSPYVGSVNLPLTVGMDALINSDGKQVEQYQRLRDQGMEAKEALDNLIETYPYGEGL